MKTVRNVCINTYLLDYTTFQPKNYVLTSVILAFIVAFDSSVHRNVSPLAFSLRLKVGCWASDIGGMGTVGFS